VAVADFANLLKASIGLDASSIGTSAVERAVLERASACGVAGPDAYWQHVCASPEELQELIEAVVVPETWFFRDRAAFSTVTRLARDRSWGVNTGSVRRILSLPSSTGEEPYSIAMALFDAGVRGDRFCIDAVDISAQSIACARAAVYGRNSFRGRDLGFRSRYFDADGNRHQLADRVRRQVTFRQGNLLASDAGPGDARYDVIFCRNLLIYFDRPTQERAVRALERLLTPGGVVLVAPSETSVLLHHGFVPLPAPMTFAFQTADAATGERKTERLKAASVQPRRVHYVPAPAKVSVALPSKTDATAETVVNLDEAVELANRGQLEEAIDRCEQHLKRSGPSAEVFHLMGLVRDANGNAAEAMSCYRKALYLDPNHDEALVHLSLLLQKAGKTSEAELLRKRAYRHQQHIGVKNAPTV